jgi:hypothetical protein
MSLLLFRLQRVDSGDEILAPLGLGNLSRALQPSQTAGILGKPGSRVLVEGPLGHLASGLLARGFGPLAAIGMPLVPLLAQLVMALFDGFDLLELLLLFLIELRALLLLLQLSSALETLANLLAPEIGSPRELGQLGLLALVELLSGQLLLAQLGVAPALRRLLGRLGVAFAVPLSRAELLAALAPMLAVRRLLGLARGVIVTEGPALAGLAVRRTLPGISLLSGMPVGSQPLGLALSIGLGLL